jgi:60 kDa SS-A/Ro ribonucleoprotein
MKLNILKLAHLARPRTYEGAPAAVITSEQALRRSVLACMLWEDEFYEEGVSIAARIRELVPKVAAEKVAALAVEARTAMKLRHAPLLLVREMARHATHRALVAETLVRVIQRADELSEFVAVYWAEGRRPLSAQVKKGLAAAFTNFDEYALAKYGRASVVRLRDVLFLSHAKPRDIAQADKRTHWERLLAEHKLGALALLRNLRNMKDAGVPEWQVVAALDAMGTDRVLPFRFLAAARHAPLAAGQRQYLTSSEACERHWPKLSLT